MSIRAALVYEGELVPSVDANGFFDVIIRFKDLIRVAI